MSSLRTERTPRTLRTLPCWASLALLGASGCLAFHPERLPDAPPDDGYHVLGETTVHYHDDRPQHREERGAVVLIHGFGGTTASWKRVRPALAQAGLRVVALDLRGHGWTTRPEGDYSIDAQARLVLDLLDQLGIERVSVVGHSWGSAIALRAATLAPRRVARVGLLAGMFFEEQQPLLFSWARLPVMGEVIYGAFYGERQEDKMAFSFFDPERAISQELVESVERVMDLPGTRASALAGVRAMDYSTLEPLYPDIEQPVLILWGREDRVTPLEWGERLYGRLPNARLEVVPRCGHLPMIEVPLATTGALVRFPAPAPATALATTPSPRAETSP